MIFEMPIDHFPSKSCSSINRSETRSSLPLRMPFSSASCLEINKAVQEEPTGESYSFFKESAFPQIPEYPTNSRLFQLLVRRSTSESLHQFPVWLQLPNFLVSHSQCHRWITSAFLSLLANCPFARNSPTPYLFQQ